MSTPGEKTPGEPNTPPPTPKFERVSNYYNEVFWCKNSEDILWSMLGCVCCPCLCGLAVYGIKPP